MDFLSSLFYNNYNREGFHMHSVIHPEPRIFFSRERVQYIYVISLGSFLLSETVMTAQYRLPYCSLIAP